MDGKIGPEKVLDRFISDVESEREVGIVLKEWARVWDRRREEREEEGDGGHGGHGGVRSCDLCVDLSQREWDQANQHFQLT